MKRLLIAAAASFSLAAMAQSSGVKQPSGVTQPSGTQPSGVTQPSGTQPSGMTQPSGSSTTTAYNIEGTVSKADKNSLTLERPGLPPAQLDIKDRTAVLVDGQRVSTITIPEGSMVRAQFQLEGDKPVALRILVSSHGNPSSPSPSSPTEHQTSDPNRPAGDKTTTPKP
jgi:hypothetical protein